MNANQRNRACFYNIYMYPQRAYASTGKLVYVSSLYRQVEFLPAVFFTSNNNQPTVLEYYRLSCVCVCVRGRLGGGGGAGRGAVWRASEPQYPLSGLILKSE